MEFYSIVFEGLNYLAILLLLCFFKNPDFLLLHTIHFDDTIDLPFLVFRTFEFRYSVFPFHFKQYVNMFHNA